MAEYDRLPDDDQADSCDEPWIDAILKRKMLSAETSRLHDNPDLKGRIQPKITRLRKEINEMEEEELLRNGYGKLGNKWVHESELPEGNYEIKGNKWVKK